MNHYVIDEHGNVEPTDDIIASCVSRRHYGDIKKTTVAGRYLVSTAFLLFNHSFIPDKLELFETMVFDENGELEELVQERYATVEEARAGHDRIVIEIQDRLNCMEIPK